LPTEGGAALSVALDDFSDEGFALTNFPDGRFEIRLSSEEQAEFVNRLFAHELPPYAVMIVGDLGLDPPPTRPHPQYRI
jgi:hypothetical protein